MRTSKTVDHILRLLKASDHGVETLDHTDGSPELLPDLRRLDRAARQLGLEVIDRCNLRMLSEPG